MPANFTEEERKEIKERLIALGYDLIREMGLKKMKVSTIAERADIATGTFYHFFASKEAYVEALIEAQNEEWQKKLALEPQNGGKLTLEQAVRWFRDSFRPENNILMELTFDDWVWLKSHRTEDGMFSTLHDEREAKRYLAYVDGIRPDLDVRVIINFFKTIYSMAQNRAIEKGITTQEEMNANAKKNKLVGILMMVVFSVFITCVVNRQFTFLDGFLQSYIFFNAFSLFDALVIDSIWFCHSKWWVIPGTEDMTEAYHDYAFHWKWFFLGLLLSLPLALILGGIVALIGVIV